MQTAAEYRFGPQTVLPVQFYPERATGPEQRLMLAVLEDALGVYRKYPRMPDRRHRRLVAEAEQWLFSDDTSWPFSCVNVCHTVGIDVSWLRGQLRRPRRATTVLDALPLTAAAS
jgi:hypothetical protein